jgi:hypothetical protein
MTTSAEEHTITGWDLLTKADEALRQNDLLQASEKGWGAAAHMVKGVAQRRGWRHGGHRELYQVVNGLEQESGDSEFRVLFNAASALHSNFYENWMPREMIAGNLEQVREFLQKLDGLP